MKLLVLALSLASALGFGYFLEPAPTGAPTGDERAKRGGPWYNVPRDVRLANRVPYFPVGVDGIFGFRVARTTP